MQIEIYPSYIVCDLVLDGYGVTCIKILVRNLYKLQGAEGGRWKVKKKERGMSPTLNVYTTE